MKVGVINIPTSVGAKAWRRCWLLIAARCSIFGINEAFAPAAKALYIALAQLERKGLLSSEWGEATAARGGHRKRLYKAEPAGIEAIMALTR